MGCGASCSTSNQGRSLSRGPESTFDTKKLLTELITVQTAFLVPEAEQAIEPAWDKKTSHLYPRLGHGLAGALSIGGAIGGATVPVPSVSGEDNKVVYNSTSSLSERQVIGEESYDSNVRLKEGYDDKENDQNHSAGSELCKQNDTTTQSEEHDINETTSDNIDEDEAKHSRLVEGESSPSDKITQNRDNENLNNSKESIIVIENQ